MAIVIGCNPFDAATPALIECFEANQRAYAAGKLKPNYPPPAIPMLLNIQPCAVWVYELPDEMTERITYLAFDYLSSSHKIWG